MKMFFLFFITTSALSSCMIQSNSMVEAQKTDIQKNENESIPESKLSKKEKVREYGESSKIDPSKAVSNPGDLSAPVIKKKKQ